MHATADNTATPPTVLINADSDVLSPAWLRAVAELAQGRGPVRFTPGGGVLLDRPLSRQERLKLPPIQELHPHLINLPNDRFASARRADAEFDAFVSRYTVAHAYAGYRLVVIPIAGGLDAAQLRAIADMAEAFGHGIIRLTADVSIRLPNVPEALLRPLWRKLTRVGLIHAGSRAKAA
ncbi:MAG: hypothetical protein Q9M41_00790 [Paracoccaceae bacterium]|nr:hypothetical protein [Paracoccaceae bacterium]